MTPYNKDNLFDSKRHFYISVRLDSLMTYILMSYKSIFYSSFKTTHIILVMKDIFLFKYKYLIT